MDVEAIFFLVFCTLVLPAAWIFLTPLAKRYRRRMEEADLPPDALAELERLQARVGELEERLDFAERLLAQHRDADQLPRGTV